MPFLFAILAVAASLVVRVLLDQWDRKEPRDLPDLPDLPPRRPY